MDHNYMRLERQVARLERELQMLKSTRHNDKAVSDHYMRLKGTYARKRALLETSRRSDDQSLPSQAAR